MTINVMALPSCQSKSVIRTNQNWVSEPIWTRHSKYFAANPEQRMGDLQQVSHVLNPQTFSPSQSLSQEHVRTLSICLHECSFNAILDNIICLIYTWSITLSIHYHHTMQAVFPINKIYYYCTFPKTAITSTNKKSTDIATSFWCNVSVYQVTLPPSKR